ncbi:hypothetical protein EXIGLDRAFT_841597 [Exidia glandulosa HHB12029]|uniref:DUF7918 domain-containing protein n=1 Tax=Exidia glandulosa HHB12029 TaxID=1314781 RepID=A0A165DT18_EXIGL|nr:hypothetical protein EXIGLDRAFT_841597 [Exidia glandulosa HHB12029]
MPPQATTLTHLGTEVWVECEGVPLPVYGVETTGTKATCWIASQAGKSFSVHFKPINENLRGEYCGDVYVDGTFINGSWFDARDVNYTLKLSHALVGRVQRKLYFSALKTSDDEQAVKDNKILSSLGDITLTITRVRVGPEEFIGDEWDVPSHLDGDQFTVDEREKKLGGHHVTLGAPEVSHTRLKTVYFEGTPLTTFEFKYRPKEILQAQDIIPMERAPAPPLQVQPLPKRRRDSSAPNAADPPKKRREVELEGEPADGDPEALRARIRALEAELAVHRGDEAKVKVEQIHASRFFTAGQVIDLTDD